MKTPKTLDRDLSWIYFNHRILQEAQRANVPLLERLSFLGIYSNNLDEFFRVRVSTMKRVAEYESGRSPGARRELREINRLIHVYSEEFEQTFAGILAELEKEMYEHLKDRMGVFRSEPYFLELVPKGIDKAQSLAVLLKEIGLTREEMIAIGDGFNDLSMIQYAGLGIAMANAQEVVKENADFITLSNEEDGVAYAAEKFILS